MSAGRVSRGDRPEPTGSRRASTWPVRSPTPDEFVTGVVDLLDGEPLLADPTSRRLLARSTAEVLDVRLQVPESSFLRQWLLAFVDECARHAGGFDALCVALARLDRGGRVSRAVRALVDAVRVGDTSQVGDAPAVSAPADTPGAEGARRVVADPRHPAAGSLEPAGSGPAEARGVTARAQGVAGGAVPSAGRGPEPLGPEPLAPREVTELAVIYAEPARARRLLRAAGLPVERHPYFTVDSQSFWTAVSDLLASGALADGRTRLLTEAAAEYPSNTVFAGTPAVERSHRAASPEPPPPSQPLS